MKTNQRRVRHSRIALLLVTAFALVASLIGITPAAKADESANQASITAAAEWIKGQWDASPATAAGTIADYILALSSADAHHETIDEMLDALATAGPSYATTPANLGKVLVAASAGGHPEPAHLFGPERDLEAELLTMVEEQKSVASFGSYLALVALLRLDADIPEESLTYLTERMYQNSSGGFSWGASATTGDPDFTGLGISALNLLAETTDDAAVRTSALESRDLAIAWAQNPANQQTKEDLYYWSASSPANSTGFIAGALAESGLNVEIPQAYLRELQAQTVSGAAWPSTASGTADNLMATLQAVFALTGKMYAHAQRTVSVTPEPTPTVTVTAPATKSVAGVCDSPSDGVSVVIDFGDLTPDGAEQIVGGCAEGEQADGFDALANAGFSLNEGIDGAQGGTVCTINGIPQEGYPDCWFVGYWSYWHAEPGSVWEYSQFGAGGRTPAVGTVEGWRWLSLEDLMAPPEAGPSFVAGVDVTAPVITVTQRPAALVTGTSAKVDFGVDDLGANLECRLDDAPWDACPPPSGWDASSHTFTVTGLTAGDHVISIRATDSWGNTAVTEIPFAQGQLAPTPTVTETITAEPTSTPTITETVTAEPTSTPTITETVTAEPTNTPTITQTVTAEPTNTPTITQTVTAEPTSKPFDVYTTVGTHKVNGRTWHTVCEEYSSTVDRCRTEIWASAVTLVDGKFVQSAGWAFNNLTYIGGTREEWAGNPLGEHNAPDGWTADDNRRWYTECDTATTGRGGCRSYIWGTTYGNMAEAGEPVVLGQQTGWTFNNMVRFA